MNHGSTAEPNLGNLSALSRPIQRGGARRTNVRGNLYASPHVESVVAATNGLLDQPHGHPFPVWFYITGGSIRIRDEEQGVTHDLHPGCMVKVTAGHRHSEELVHYEVIVATEAGALPAVTV